jgi:hypothetical protein
MPQNTTKNVLISAALITFIISSGAFTIYQLAKKQTNTAPTTSIINSTTTNSLVNSFSGNNNITGTLAQPKEVNIGYNLYVCGLEISGTVEKPSSIAKLEFTLTNKDKPEIKQSFLPNIDLDRNFKMLVDSTIIVDGVYKLETLAISTSQKTETTETTIEFKKDCGNMIQNSSSASVVDSSNTSQIKVANEASPLTTTVSSAVQQTSSSITIDVPTKLTILPTSSSVSSLSSSDSSSIENNINAVRTGGLNYTSLVAILFLVLTASLVAKLKIYKPKISDIFGK